MRKSAKFKKELSFPSMIGEITAISLEHTLKFIDNIDIEGEFIVTGKYKLTEASRLEEDFSYKIPIEIVLTERLDIESAKIEIVDFYYEIKNENTLVCNIEIMIEGVEIIDDDRECDGDSADLKEKEIPKIEDVIVEDSEENNLIEDDFVTNELSDRIDEIDEDIEVENDNEIANYDKSNESIFNLDYSAETFGTFIVYIVRQNETINTIIEKYNTSLEELEKYNNIKDISIGSKLIIPLINNEDK